MKKKKKRSLKLTKKSLILLAVAALLIAAAVILLLPCGGVYVDGEDISRVSGNVLTLGSGSAIYDKESRTLRLIDAQIASGVRASGDLNIEFEGESNISGDKNALYAGGNLTLSGEGSVTVSGGEFALRTGGDLNITGHVTLDLEGGTSAMRCGGAFSQDALYVNLDGNDAAITDLWTATRLVMRAPVRLRYTSYGGGDQATDEFSWGTSGMSLPTPVREGFSFLGWYLSNRYEEAFDTSAALREDMMLYAMWEKQADRVLSGVDVSSYQEEIDWSRVKAAGIDFALLRVGFRGWGAEGTLNADTYFEENAAAAKAAGIDVGVYFYSQATTTEEAVAEADFVLEQLQGKAPDLPVCFDLEYAEQDDGHIGRLYDANLSASELADICQAFCERVEAAGCESMVYANYSMLSGGLGEMLSARGIRIWLAQWNAATYYVGDYEIWQYSASGSVDGISGKVDMNKWYVDEVIGD